MTRQDLIDILKQDGTQQQIEEYVAAKELTEQERDHIYEFLRADDQQKAEEHFQDIFDDISAKPTYEDAKSEKNSWKEYRIDIAKQIKQLKDAEFECKYEIRQMENAIKDARKNLGEGAAKIIEDAFAPRIQDATNKLDLKTKQHGALALMHAEAKSMEAQARGREFLEATQPLRDTLKHSWQSLTEQTIGLTKHTFNITATILKTNDLDFHPIKDAVNRAMLFYSRSQIKDLNQIKSKIEKEEKKIVDQANKISKKEFRKNEFLNRMNSWSKGVRPQDNGEYSVIKDVEQAKAVLGEAGTLRSKMLQHNLDKLNEMRRDVETNITKALDRIERDLMDRQQKVQEIAQDIAQKMEHGEYGNGQIGMATIERNLQQGYESAFLSDRGLSDDLREFMEEHGYNHLIAGAENISGTEDVAQEVEHDVEQDVDNPFVDEKDDIEMDDPEIGDR